MTDRRRARRRTDLTAVGHGRGRHALRRRGGARAWPSGDALLSIPRGLHRTRVSEMRVLRTRPAARQHGAAGGVLSASDTHRRARSTHRRPTTAIATT